MKRQHLTTLTATGIALLVVLVVLLKLKGERNSPEANKPSTALQQRQAERFRESRLARQASAIRSPNSMHDFAAMKERMLEEFPNLRSAPPIPNEHNPMYLLNELAMELVDSVGPFRSELESIMRSDKPWDLEAAQALLEKYSSAIDRLEKIGSMNVQGSNRFTSVVDRSKHDDSLMLFLDLLRLKEWVHEQTSDSYADTAISMALRRLGVGLPNVILNSKGSTIRHSRMVESHMLASGNSPMDRELYESLGRFAAYDAHVLNWHLPDWGRTLSNELLIDTLKDQWESHFSMIMHSEISMDTDEGAVRAYSARISQMVEELKNTSMLKFYNASTPELPNDGSLTPDQLEWAQERSRMTRENLRSIMVHAAHQNLKTAAFYFHREENSGSFNVADLIRAHPNPATGKPMTFDPKTRILKYQDPIEGQAHVGILLWPTGKGSLTVPGKLLLRGE